MFSCTYRYGENFKRSKRSFKKIRTVAGYKVGEVEIEFPDGDVDVVRVDTEAWLSTFRSLFQSLPIRGLQRNRLEEDHHYQIQSPYLLQYNI